MEVQAISLLITKQLCKDNIMSTITNNTNSRINPSIPTLDGLRYMFKTHNPDQILTAYWFDGIKYPDYAKEVSSIGETPVTEAVFKAKMIQLNHNYLINM